MRRDVSWFMKMFVKASAKPKEIIPGFITSLNAAYTVDEIEDIVKRSNIVFHS